MNLIYNKFKNFFIRLNIDEEIEYAYEGIDMVETELEDYENITAPKNLTSELEAYKNKVRRLKKLKEKYS